MKREWLISLREKKEYTHEQVAEKAGIERSTYTKAENGKQVSVSTAKSISGVLGCNWILFFEDDCAEKSQTA